MNQRFERVARHLYQRKYRGAAGDWTTLYYARFVCRLKGKHRIIPLGSDEAKAKDKLKRLEAQDVDGYDFDLDRQRMTEPERPRDGKTAPFTFTEWADKYPTFDDIKRKRSLGTDLLLIRLHLKPFFGEMLLTEITREALTRYIDARTASTIIRCEKLSKKTVTRGTVSNELSLLRRMLRLAAREDYKVIVPSFDALIVRTDRGGRALTDDEKPKLLAEYPPWMRRLADFADETCLSQGDLLRLTEEMIDAKAGIIRLEHGRRKTGVEQVPPLTLRCRQILAEIEIERKQSKIRNVHGLVFTNPDGSPISKGQIEYQVERAVSKSGIRKFVFHNYRNTALTRWARQGINVDVAMKASGHSSVQMHKRYVDLQARTSPQPSGPRKLLRELLQKIGQPLVNS